MAARAALAIGLVGGDGGRRAAALIALVAALSRRGLAVSAVHCPGAGVAIDRPGKDSDRHRAAGAAEVMITSAKRWALVGDGGGELAPLLARLATVDVVLINDAPPGVDNTVAVPEDGAIDDAADAAIVALAGRVLSLLGREVS